MSKTLISWLAWLAAAALVGCSSGGSFQGKIHPTERVTAQQTDGYVQTWQKKKEALDRRQTRYLVLPNKLRVELISDSSLKHSAMSVSVGTGTYANPKEYRGLAHFLEHMLFLGSAKYPKPDEFQNFLSSHQGMTNAFTADEQTNFHFEIPNQFYTEAVDRMTQFFISPQFDPTYLDKELHAIQSEYDKNTQSTVWRLDNLQHLAIGSQNPEHWSFQGNTDTLEKVPRDVMMAFYKRWYSANNITATMISTMPIDDLEALARQTLGAVPNRDVPLLNVRPVTKDLKDPALFKASSATDSYMLDFSYSLSPLNFEDAWKTKSYQLLATQLGSEKPGSLIQVLKERGLISSMNVWNSNSRSQNGFEINIDLTPQGYKQWQTVASGILAYIEALKTSTYPPNLFKNSQRLAELNYVFKKQDPLNEAVLTAGLMHQYQAPPFEAKNMLIPVSSPELYRQALTSLQLTNLNVTLFAPDIHGDQKAEFYDYTYSQEPLLSQDWVKKPQAISGVKIQPVPANPYLPQNLDMVTSANPTQPTSLIETPAYSVSALPAARFQRPLANALVDLTASDQLQKDPRFSLLASLLTDYAGRALTPWQAEPNEAGYSVQIDNNQADINLVLSGYTDRIAYFAKGFLQQLAQLKIDSELFAQVKEQTVLALKNKELEDAYKQLIWVQRLALDPNSPSNLELIDRIQSINAADLQNFKDQLFAAGHLRVLYYGNVTDTMARESGSEIAKLLDLKSVPAHPAAAVQFPKGRSALVLSRQGENNAWVEDDQFGPLTADNVARMQLLGTLLETPFYGYMRTEKQLGYIVWSVPNLDRGSTGMALIVQSQKPSTEVSAEAHKWILQFADQLKQVPQEQFDEIKQGLVNELTKPAASLQEDFAHVKSVFVNRLPYDLKQRTAEAVTKLTLGDMEHDFRTLMIDQPRTLSVYLDSKTSGGPVKAPNTDTVYPDVRHFLDATTTW